MSGDEKAVARNGKLTPSYIEVILIVLIVVGGAFYGYDHYYAQKIKVVDMSGFLRQQKALLSAGEIDADGLQTNLSKVDALMSRDAELNSNHIYILKEVVLKNGNKLNINPYQN